ncbi:CBS domain-containing protein [Halobacillus alkaliphilus]|uniref:CBS domain-containing protein n=1 Tax=Halobacillus alkaliphilus TaxID=396056 RepID=A0A1I2LE81_9BACI|nr:CBS domain-containing protein [Halobacillus alkaliphilus]SFF76858.1 CBS domain-containing protein [Halobacillus alkaliphilus]
MNDLVERFEVAFNQIHQHLKEFNGYPKNDNFVELLQRSKLKHSVIRVHFDLLKQYAKLRNALVHERIRDDYYIATPHLEVVESLEHIKQTLDQPPEALEFATHPVIFFKDTSLLTEIMTAFDQQGVSQFPIYSTDNEFLGLLTNDGIVRWIARTVDHNLVNLTDITARDVLQDGLNPSIEFLSSHGTVYELEERFERSLEEERKLKAVILTESGKANDAPLGIVTTWDLIKVDRRNEDE